MHDQRAAAKAVAPVVLQLDDPRWHSFVGSWRNALSFHHPAWAALVADCYGYRAFAFTLQASDGDIVAGAPVIEVTNPLKRRRWISLPFTDECPLLADSESSVPFGAALRTAGIDEGVKSLELRTRIAGGGGAEYLAGVTHELVLEADADAVHRRLHPSQVRRNIQRAEREGVRVQRAERARDVVDTYYALHVRTRRRLGIPPQPRRFFQLLWERMLEPELGFALLAYLDRTPVAGAVFLSWNSRLTYKFGASDAAHWGLRPNHTIFWSAILWGCENGLEMLDFGRSALENAGLRAFKRNWGAQERPIIYTTLLGSAPYTRRAIASRATAGILRRAPLWVCRGVGTALYRYAA